MKTHYQKINPFAVLSDGTEIIGDTITLGKFCKNNAGCFRLISAQGVEILRADGWVEFISSVHRYAQEKDVVVYYTR